jgi:DNA-binding PadR family transcriptional regulator
VPPQNSDSVFTQRVRKRVLIACLDAAIMEQLSERRVLSATNIIAIFKKRFNIQLSPGTVYPVLYALEREGKIKRLPNRTKKLYVITNKGEISIKNLQANAGDIHMMIDGLIK